MKNILSTFVILALAGSAFAGPIEENTKALKVDVFADEDSIDESYLGIEVGFGVALYDLDMVTLFGGHAETEDDIEFQYFGIEIEEHYPVNDVVIPFAGLSAGYALSEKSGVDAKEGVFGRAQGGVKIAVTEQWLLTGTVRFWLGSEDVLLDGDQFNDNRWDVALGLRFHY